MEFIGDCVQVGTYEGGGGGEEVVSIKQSWIRRDKKAPLWRRQAGIPPRLGHSNPEAPLGLD